MNHKPASIADFLKTVAFVQHRKLTPTDRHLLLCIALYADAKTGRRAWPGKKNLIRATGLGRTWVKSRLDFLESEGLIQTMAFAKGGRGMATEYRICLESSAYLDGADSSDEAYDEERGHSTDPIESEKGSLGNAKGVTPEQERGQSILLKGSLQCPPSESSSQIHPTLHPSEIRKADGGMDSSKPSAKEIPEPGSKTEADTFFSVKRLSEMGDVEKSVRPKIERLAAKHTHGWKLLTEAYDNHWLKRDKGLGGLQQKWEKFRSEAERIYIPQITSEDWWKERFDPEYRARVAATIERQRQERVWLHADPEPEPELMLAPGQAF